MGKSSRVIPIFRIFDYRKATEFYIDWLQFKVDWQHRFDDNSPVYLQVSRDDLVFHLSEHHGDATPGSKVFIEFAGDLKSFHQELTERNYQYNKPGLEEAFYDAWTMEITDPFGNKILFNQYKK